MSAIICSSPETCAATRNSSCEPSTSQILLSGLLALNKGLNALKRFWNCADFVSPPKHSNERGMPVEDVRCVAVVVWLMTAWNFPLYSLTTPWKNCSALVRAALVFPNSLRRATHSFCSGVSGTSALIACWSVRGCPPFVLFGSPPGFFNSEKPSPGRVYTRTR